MIAMAPSDHTRTTMVPRPYGQLLSLTSPVSVQSKRTMWGIIFPNLSRWAFNWRQGGGVNKTPWLDRTPPQKGLY